MDEGEEKEEKVKRRQSEGRSRVPARSTPYSLQSARLKSGLICTFNRGPPESRDADSSQWNGVALQRGEECANMR